MKSDLSLFKFLYNASVKQRRREPMGGFLRAGVVASGVVVLAFLFTPLSVYAAFDSGNYQLDCFFEDGTNDHLVEYICTDVDFMPYSSDFDYSEYGAYYYPADYALVNDYYKWTYGQATNIGDLRIIDSSTYDYIALAHYVGSFNINVSWGGDWGLSLNSTNGSLNFLSDLYVNRITLSSCGDIYYVPFTRVYKDKHWYYTIDPVVVNKITTSKQLFVFTCYFQNTEVYAGKGDIPSNAYTMSYQTSIIGQLSIDLWDGYETESVFDQNVYNSINNQTSQDYNFHQQDKSDATMAGQDMSGFASQLDNLKNTWAILWYPIEFTNKFVQVFTGGTQTAAFDDYDYVSGYRYNNDTGMLEPMMSRSIQSRTVGTGITFPSIELMGYTLWEPYTYDLSTLKDQFPVIFDALYVFISMLEVFWFVGFLRSKYNEVFG